MSTHCILYLKSGERCPTLIGSSAAKNAALLRSPDLSFVWLPQVIPTFILIKKNWVCLVQEETATTFPTETDCVRLQRTHFSVVSQVIQEGSAEHLTVLGVDGLQELSSIPLNS